MTHKPNHVEEYFKDTIHEQKKYELLFNVSKDNIDLDLKTEVSEQELRDIVTLKQNDDFLSKHGIKPVFDTYIEKFLRLKISLQRKSREEFVRVNRPEPDDQTNFQQNVKTLMGVK